MPGLKIPLAIGLLSLLLGRPAMAEDGVGISDGRGFFYSVTNRQAALHSYFQVTKLTLTGGVVWNVPFSLNADITATALTVDRDGDVIVAGTIRENNRLSVLVVKFTAYGSLYFRKINDAGATAIPNVIVADSAKNFYVASTVSEAGGSYVRMLRYDPNGTLYWAQKYRFGRTNYPRYIVLDQGDNAITSIETAPDARSNHYQMRQVLFTVYGGIAPL